MGGEGYCSCHWCESIDIKVCSYEAERVSANVRIREAVSGDAPKIAVLSGELGYPSTEAEIAHRLMITAGDSSHAVVVAEHATDGVVGWLHVSTIIHLESGRFAEIVGLVVDKRHRGGGIGKMLVESAEQWASAQGCGTITVRSNVIRKETHEFYRRLGFPLVKQQSVFKKLIS